MAGERPPSRGYEGSNPRPRTNYDKTRAADGRSWGNDRKEGGRSEGGRSEGGERTWNKKKSADGERKQTPRGRSERPTYPGKGGGSNRADGEGNGNRFKKRGPRSEDGPDFRRNDGGFSSPKKPSGNGAKRSGPSDGKPRRKPSFAR